MLMAHEMLEDPQSICISTENIIHFTICQILSELSMDWIIVDNGQTSRGGGKWNGLDEGEHV